MDTYIDYATRLGITFSMMASTLAFCGAPTAIANKFFGVFSTSCDNIKEPNLDMKKCHILHCYMNKKKEQEKEKETTLFLHQCECEHNLQSLYQYDVIQHTRIIHESGN